MRVSCPTCYELISPADGLVALPCGHVFHAHCVIQWFDTKKNCPQCRHPANEKNMRKIYLSEVDEEGLEQNPDSLRAEVENLQLKLRQSKMDLEALKSSYRVADELNTKLKAELKVADTSKRKAEQTCKDLKTESRYWKEERDRFHQYQTEAENLKKQVEKYILLERVLNDSVGEVNMLLHERGSFDRESRDLATLVVELKKKLVDVKRQKALAERRADDSTIAREDDRRRIKSLSVQVSELRTHKESLDSELRLSLDRITELSTKAEQLEARTAEQEETIRALRENSPAISLIDWTKKEEDDTKKDIFNLSSRDSPALSFKSYSISAGEKRKPLSQLEPDNKRSKAVPNLLEVGVQPSQGQTYDGFGGRSKPDIFPQPLYRPTIKKVQKKTATKNSLINSRERQKQTIDKFFGNFETP